MARRKKRVSPLIANRRALAIASVPVGWGGTPKVLAGRRGWWRFTSRLHPSRVKTEAEAVHDLAVRLLKLRQEEGRWPDGSVRWWRKDRNFKRALRLAQRMFEEI